MATNERGRIVGTYSCRLILPRLIVIQVYSGHSNFIQSIATTFPYNETSFNLPVDASQDMFTTVSSW